MKKAQKAWIPLAGVFIFMVLFSPCVCAAEKLPYFKASLKYPASLVVGERFIYNISYLGLVVGQAETTVKEQLVYRGRKVYHIEVHVRSYSVIDYLYPVRDTHHSYIDAEHFHSLYYEKDLNEGRYHVHEKMTYDQQLHEAEYESLTNGSKKRMLIPKNVHDQVSAGFWFRMQKVTPGSKIVIPINADEKNWDLEVEIGQTEVVKMPGIGVFEAVKLKPKLMFQGLFIRKGKVEGFLGLDAGRIPLMMKVKVPILGSVSVKLVEYYPGIVATK